MQSETTGKVVVSSRVSVATPVITITSDSIQLA